LERPVLSYGPPEEAFLEYYAGCFGTAEVNNSFYRLPEKETLLRWRDAVPEDFVFSVIRLRERLPSPFDCQRMFGKVNLVEDAGVRAGERPGSDPLEVDADSFLPTRTNYRTSSCSLRGTREKGVRRATVKSGRAKPQDADLLLPVHRRRGD
jgi:hypothetical protein